MMTNFDLQSFRDAISSRLSGCEYAAENLSFSSRNILEPISVLVVSTNTFCDKLKYALSDRSSNRFSNINVKLAENVDQILLSELPNTHVDYMVLAIDTTYRNNIEVMKENLRHLETAFVATRMCLVNGTPKTGLMGTASEIEMLAEKYNILYMNGEIMDGNSCGRLADKILEVASVTCGFETGLPLPLPTSFDIFLQSLN